MSKIRSINPTIEPLQKTIKQIIDKYLNSEQERDISKTGLLNWFAYKPRDDSESIFDENFLIDRKDYTDKLQEMFDNKDTDRAHDSMIMSVANDLIAQVESVASFRRAKISHHFAKSLYNIEWLGKGAKKPKKSDSILEEYTTVFLENAVKHIAQ
jgi:hypothetical protein